MAKRISDLGLHPNGYWYCRVDGKQVYCKPKGCSREQAEEWHKKLRLMSAATAEANLTPDDYSVKTLFTMFLEDVRGTTSEKNYTDKARIVKRFIDAYGDKPLRAVSQDHFSAFCSGVGISGAKGNAWSNFTHLRTCLNWCKANVKTTWNPSMEVKRPKMGVRGQEFIIEPEEWTNMLPHVPEPYKSVAQVIYLTGARPSEILGATVSEWEPENNAIDKGKRHKLARFGRPRVIMLNAEAAKIVQDAIGDRKEGFIFAHVDGRSLTLTRLQEWMKAAAKEIGRTNPTVPYGLRHSFAVRQLRNQTPIATVAAWMDDNIDTVQKHYGHIWDKANKVAMLVRPV